MPSNNSLNVVCRFLNEEATSVICNGIHYTNEKKLTTHDELFWVYLGVYVILVLLAGLFSGLTMGLLSLDIMSLQVLKDAGDPKQKKYAARILPIVKKHHLLLVTLLLANAAAVESMPLFLDKISNPVTAICVSVTAVLLFGEVLPQALCTRYGLAIGATLVPVVWLLMAILFIVAWPIAKLLDLVLGKDHGTFFRRAELKALVELHGEDRVITEGVQTSDEVGNEEPLSYDEVLIIKGALELRQKTVKDAFIPIESVFALSIDTLLDRKTMQKILNETHSRFPVFEPKRPNEFVAMVIVKQLILCDPDDPVTLRSLWEEHSPAMKPISYVAKDLPLYDLLNQFQTGKSHLSVVMEGPTVNTLSVPTVYQSADMANDGNKHPDSKIIGIITLEDVIEELIQEEIIDESDVYIDVHKRIQVARAKAARRLHSHEEARRRSEQISHMTQSVNSTNQQPLIDDDEYSPLIQP